MSDFRTHTAKGEFSRDYQAKLLFIMSDAGLCTATEPLPKNAKAIIKDCVEIGGLQICQENYDADGLAVELREDRGRFKERWLRRVECVVNCREKEAFSASLTGCLAGQEE